MAELLLELLSEEIPARMQARAAHELREKIAGALEAGRIKFDRVAKGDTSKGCYSGPRRIAVHFENVSVDAEDFREERRGPRVDAPLEAIEGFLRGTGVSRGDCEEREEKNGTFLYAVIEKDGRPTVEVLMKVLPKIIRSSLWQKSMRWGDGDLKWVRPLRSILCIFDGEIVPFEIGGIPSNNQTQGHRFMAPDYFHVSDFAQYQDKLDRAKVKIEGIARWKLIEDGIDKLVAKEKFELVEDKRLLDEVGGLVEWPVPLMGSFDKAFLDLPSEVLVSEMRYHQKYFALRDKKSGELAPKFITVANIETDDGGAAIIAGNERVLAARLWDAKFFWDKDRKTSLEDQLPKLDPIVFHARLGTVGERALRLASLADQLAQFIPDCDAAEARRAGALAKADLVTGMVGEFPDLQGVMGGYYAAAQGEPEAVAAAIREHYAPKGPGDVCPSAPVSIAVALADKLDVLVGFFGIEEKPTGSKDPFALRRAALGVIRLITENQLRMPLRTAVMVAENGYLEQALKRGDTDRPFTLQGDQLWEDLMAFIADRLKVQTREAGVRHDLIDAVFSASEEEDLVRLLARVSALQDYLSTDDGADLLAGTKRAANIVRIEEKKDKAEYDGELDATLLVLDQEKDLFKRLLKARKAVGEAVNSDDFAGAMSAIAALRAPIDHFFDEVTVNTDDAGVRQNRLRLLSQIGASLDAVADFSRIKG